MPERISLLSGIVCCFINIKTKSGLPDVINNPCSYFFRAKLITTFYLNFGVRTFASKEASTALRIKAPSALQSKYSNNIATERICASGLAIFKPLPAAMNRESARTPEYSRP